MNIGVLKETADYLVISKPAGVSVHPGAGDKEKTIADWLGESREEVRGEKWRSTTRAGIVHRLDKDTSGVLLLAKKPEALEYYQNQFRKREVGKKYIALVVGKPPFDEGSINSFIRRDPKDRERQRVELVDFALDEAQRKRSATKYKTIETFNFEGTVLTLLEVELLTGRKHQIRAHMKHEGCPIIGDSKYFTKFSQKISAKLGATRQFLHATKIKFREYKTGKIVKIQDEVAGDLSKILEAFK